MQHFKDRFSQFFNHVGESQAKFAERAGIQQVTVSQLLHGRSAPSLKTANKLRDSFPNLNMDWLLDGKGEMLLDANAAVVLRPMTPADPPPPTPTAYSAEEVKYLRRENESLKEQLRQALETIKEMSQQMSFVRQMMEKSFLEGNQEAAGTTAIVRQMYPGLVAPLPERAAA